MPAHLEPANQPANPDLIDRISELLVSANDRIRDAEQRIAIALDRIVAPNPKEIIPNPAPTMQIGTRLTVIDLLGDQGRLLASLHRELDRILTTKI